MSTIVMLLGFVNAVMLMQRYNLTPAEAATGTTNVTQSVIAGTLTIVPAATAALSSVTASVTSSQNSTGNLGTVTVTDNRGSGVGWSATATSTNFYAINSAVTTSGGNSITTGGTYNNATGGTYTVTITTAGPPGTAQFSVAGVETLSNQPTTGGTVAVGTRGVTATFSGSYTIGNAWTIRVDTIPVTGFQLTPGSLTTIAGSATNVTAGSVHTFSSTADATSLITAASTGGYGMGSYSVNPALQLTIPAGTYASSYVAVVTETVL